MPAATIVAAWMSALTGVGPAIASGSQVCSGNCADLPTTPHSSSSVAMVAVRLGDRERGRGAGRRRLTCPVARSTPSMLNVPAANASTKMPNRKPTSPSRVTTNALTAPARAPPAPSGGR